MADVVFEANFITTNNFDADFQSDQNIDADFGQVTKVSTTDYEELFHKPSINSVELKGNKSFEDLGDSPLTNLEIQALFNRVFHG